MTLTLDHFTDDDERTLRDLADRLLRWDKKTGAIKESKVDARQGGFSLHIKYEKRSDVFTTTELANVHDRGVDTLFLVIRKLLGLPDGYDPDAEQAASS